MSYVNARERSLRRERKTVFKLHDFEVEKRVKQSATASGASWYDGAERAKRAIFSTEVGFYTFLPF